VDEIRVKWADGPEESFGPFEADRVVLLRRGSGKPAATKSVS
jgi:hypothetical protein